MVPFATFTPRRVPIPLKDAITAELVKLEANEVIREVDGQAEWCVGIVPVLKPSGEVRLCVDLTQPNKNVLLEQFVLPTLDDTMMSIGGSLLFLKTGR